MSRGLAILLGGALALRLALAPLPSYWVDEAFTIALLDRGLGGMLSTLVETESTPPLYYLAAWGWTQAAGLGELGLRSLSALAGAATVGLAWALGRRLAGPAAGLAAGALTAVNPFLLWFSTEARAYALATALTTAALVALLVALERPDGRRRAIWAALAAAALLAHYATVFAIGAQAAILLWRSRTRATLAAAGAVAAVGAALVPLAVAQRGNEHARSLDEMSGPLLERAAQVPKQFAIGYDAPAEVLAATVALLALAAGLAGALLAGGPLRRRALVPLAVGAAGVAAPLAATAVGVDVVAGRYLLPALPALLAVAGAGLVAGPWRRAGPAAAAALTAAWLAVFVAVAADPRLQTRPDWQGVDAALGPAPAGGRMILATPASGALVLRGAYRRRARYDPPRPVVEIALAATAGRGEDGDPPSGAPTLARSLAAAGFERVERQDRRGYALWRWRAGAPTAVDPGALVAGAAQDSSRPAAILWEP